MKSQKGFSLLEVACIIALMGIICIGAIPAMQQVKKQEARQFATQMCLELSRQKGEFSHMEGYFTIRLIEQDGKYSSYEVSKTTAIESGGVITEVTTVLDTYCGPKSLDLVVLDTSSNPDGDEPAIHIDAFKFNGTEIEVGGKQFKTLKIKLDTEELSQTITFIPETGYYSIS